jgi:hypothetical protein
MSLRKPTLAMLGLGAIAVAQISASTIDSFSFTPAADSPFTSSLNESFTSSEASITGSVSCDSDTTCTGELGELFLGVDLTGPADVPVDYSISGSLSGDTAGSGDLVIATIPEPFVIPTGDFSENILSHDLQPTGMVELNAIVNLTIPADETVTLPLTFTVGTPEPVGQSMIVLGLLGFAGLLRQRSARRIRRGMHASHM